MPRHNFSRRRHMHALSEINVTPLLDMCFCLLIIFMIATPVLEQTTLIDLPLASRAIATPQPQTPIKPLTITLDKRHQIIFEGRVMSEEALSVELRRLAALPAEQRPLIHLRGDGDLPYKHIMRIYSLAKKSGIEKMGLATEQND
ncbi:MAG: biopolymer transporter ExbD [Puniceicoccales bacterium]|nr:biopolymer transporter ExbD [Puniceicoccales bacterium]